MSPPSYCSQCGAKLHGQALGGLCLECVGRGLLAGDDRKEEFHEPQALDQGPTLPGPPPEESLGASIGPYKLLEKIGEGGCGTVYVADQEKPVRRRVAVKVIKLGMDTREVIARFEAERQALAMMDHPNVAKVLDAGTTESGRPYFVMELVRGIRITDYCDQANLSTRARLDLFIKVCQAIQHAHQKGIIHRDIKPSNILVTLLDGVPVPKVIDFGIAKATEGRLTDSTVYTQLNQFMGTPAYMSPEQAEMSALDIDTRSDIYSLGVLLYELLAGSTPFDGKELLALGVEEMRRTIREKEPLRPSTRLSQSLVAADVRRLQSKSEIRNPKSEIEQASSRRLLRLKETIGVLRGDLDWIVMKALEKDRTRRYDTANGFAMDITRYLTNEPIVARPPSTAYRVQKFVRRNRLPVFGAAAILVTLLLGVVVSGIGFFQAKRQSARAVRSEGKARQSLYEAGMNLAYQACQENNLGLALGLLDGQRPAPDERDLRSWEWRYLWSLCQSEVLYTLGQHSNIVQGLAISPNGRLLATVGGGELKIWDLESRRLVETPERNYAYAPLAFSPDSKLLAYLAGKPDRGEVILWDVQEHREITHFPGEEGERGWPGLGFSPSGRQLAVGTTAGPVVLWDLATQTAASTLKGNTNQIHSLVFSPDGQSLVTGSFDRTIRVWSLANGEQIAAFTNHANRVQCLALSPDGKTVASGSWDKTVRIWDLDQKRQVAVLTHHTDWVFGVAFSPDGKTLASAGNDHLIKLWDTRKWEEVSTLKGSQDHVGPLAFSSDGKTLFSGTSGGQVLAWDGQPRPPKPLFLKWPGEPDSHFLSSYGIPICGNSNNTFNFWDPLTLHKLPEHPNPEFDHGSNTVTEISSGGERLACATTEGPVYVWDVERGRQVARLAGWPSNHPLLDFSPDGKFLAEVAAGKGLKIWNLENSEEVATLPKSAAHPSCEPRFTTNNLTVATGNSDGTVEVWDVLRKARVANWPAHINSVTGVAFMPNGRRLVTVGEDGTAKLWEFGTQPVVRVRSFSRALTSFFCVAVSPDGERIAAGTGTPVVIKVWSSTTGQELVTLKGVNGWMDPNSPETTDAVKSLAFVPPDGNTLISASSYEVRLWRAPSWAEIAAAEKKTEGKTPQR